MESGWQSNIHNCDGGPGIMQVMPDTVAIINNRFEQTYDSARIPAERAVGANYLAWLAKCVGDTYFGQLQPERRASARRPLRGAC